jgi:hypothetical protein
VSKGLRVGVGNSYGLRATIAANADFDPSQPTGGVFVATKPSGPTVMWPVVIVAQSAASIEVRYAFNANGLDVDVDGIWRVWIQWSVSGQTPH